MPVADALRMIEMLRSSASLRQRLREVTDDGGLQAAPMVGAEHDLTFTGDELRRAFAIDWTMRAFHDRRPAPSREPDR